MADDGARNAAPGYVIAPGVKGLGVRGWGLDLRMLGWGQGVGDMTDVHPSAQSVDGTAAIWWFMHQQHLVQWGFWRCN